MKRQQALFVILLGMLLIMGCESDQAAKDVPSAPPQSVQPSPFSQVTASPVPAVPVASVEPAATVAAGKVQASPTPGLANRYSLDEIERILHEDHTVFDVVESPNRRAVAYMVSPTGSAYDDMTLHIWNVGEEKPRASQAGPESTVGEVFWSPNSDYVFVDAGTYVVRGGGLYSAKTLEVVESFGYLHRVYFSPDGKHIVYSTVSDRSVDTLKSNYLDPGEAFNLVVYEIDKHQETLLFNGTGTEDFIAVSWLDSNTISYLTTTYSVENDQIHDVTTKYMYELNSQTSRVDPTQKKPTTDGDEKTIRSLYSDRKDIFDDTWSPDWETLVYAQGDEQEGHGSVWFWRKGEEKPVQVAEEKMLNRIIWSNDSRYFMFNSGISSEDTVYVVDTQTAKVQSAGFFRSDWFTGLPYFSADSRYLLFSGVEDISTTYRNNTETGNSHNVSLLDLGTGEVKVLFPADEKRDYVPLGWSGERRIVYRVIDYSTDTRELAEYDWSE